LKKADHRATLRVINRDQVAAIVTWEGTPIGFVRPHAVLNLSGLPQGEFRIGVRDFFGAELNPVKPTKLENTSELSWRELSDAGTK
jgi:hypothetical protein